MLFELNIANYLRQLKSTDVSQPIGFLQFILFLLMGIAYLFTYGRAVWTAFSCQGIVQGLLALFFFPIYVIWNLTSLIRAIHC